jgi:outer membrane receptor protein involved in Fe transport
LHNSMTAYGMPAQVRFHRSPLTVLFLVILLTAAWGQSSKSGIVSGVVSDPSGAVIPNASVRLVNSTARYDRTITTDGEGRYRFLTVPFGAFSLHIEAVGFAAANFDGEVKGTAAVLHNVQFKSATLAQQITVEDTAVNAAATHFDFDNEELERGPLSSPNDELPAVVESVPGVVPEENGRLHVRSSEAQPQYVLDGISIAENLSSDFGTALDSENLRTTQIITGNVPAEFGGRVPAVVNLTTKSGLEMPWNGSLSFSGGSFDSGAVDLEAGGHVRNIGIFLTGDVSRTNRFYDPPEITNFHNQGGVAHILSRFDWAQSEKNTFRMTLSTNGSSFQVPNDSEQQEEGQHIRQDFRDDYQALAWSHIFNETTTSEVTFFRRSSSAKLSDPGITGTPFYLAQNRRQRSEGLQANLIKEWRGHQFKAGIEARRLPVNEFFTLAVTDPEDVDEDSPVQEFTPDEPFIFNQRRAGSQGSLFVQDHARLGEHWTVDAGLRYDHADMVVHDNAMSPRIGIAYRVIRTNTVLHASYNRLFQVPDLENLLLSSSPEAAELQSEDVSGLRTIKAERQNHYQFGIQQQIARHVQLGVLHYVKNVHNWLDDEELFETPVIFPVQLARGDVRGTEVRLDLMSLEGWTGYVSYANSKATVTAPLIGGLFLETDEGEFADAGHQFPADSVERNEGQAGLTYAHKSGAWGSFKARYDSGIPSDFEADDYPSFDPRIQQQLDPVRIRLKPRTLLDLAIGADLLRESSHPISLQFGVNNLLDRFYLYNFRSIFSGTHVGRPREFIVRATFHWRTK